MLKSSQIIHVSHPHVVQIVYAEKTTGKQYALVCHHTLGLRLDVDPSALLVPSVHKIEHV